jgi:undecaprenyl-diphosphatase
MTKTRDRAVLVGALVAFGAWTAAVRAPALAAADRAITQWLQQFASPTVDALLSLITVLGNAEVTVVLALLMGVALIRRGQAPFALALWAVFVSGSGLEWVTKHWLPHPGVPLPLQRPGFNIFHHRFYTPYSYLSGHAFRTFLLATAASWIWAPPVDRVLWVRYALGALVVLMGVGLVYLGDHWASEVIGGYLLAAVCVMLLRVTPRGPASPPRH